MQDPVMFVALLFRGYSSVTFFEHWSQVGNDDYFPETKMPPRPSLHVLWILVFIVVIGVCGSEDQVAGLLDGPMHQVAGLVDGPMDQVANLVNDPIDQVEARVNGPMDQVVNLVDSHVDQVAGLVGDPMDQSAGLVDDPVDQMSDLVDSFMNQVAVVVSQVVEQHLTGCHLVLATTADNTSVFSRILRRLAGGGEASTVVDVGLLFSQGQPAQHHLLQGLWGDVRFSCRALILYTGTNYNTLLFRFLESSGLWLWPETSVVVVGTRTGMESVLLHSSLRNTVHLLYLALEILPRQKLPVNTWLRKGPSQQGNVSQQ
ncbi:uncharacterized protein [Panulirus ornatus]|uniref:uncharacterized protein n=1 Tax=Panulirus ornatus TaxID=150431 RepID=UPI003A88CCB3